ncbi:MAG TPA: hypothetical protein VMB72_00465 [Acidimicrobiales bacterium]|nr:hypothetical protein [Acidimicrobiales bacterium]
MVVLTSFPLSEVLTQRSALRSTTHQLAAYTAADRDLSREVAALEEPGAAGVVARRDYGFVPAGDQAFDILPAAGSALPRSTASGYVPLDGGPVSPGSARSQALAGVPPLPPAPPATTHRHAAHDAVTAAAGGGDAAVGPSPGYWGRVLRSLEFWN